MRILLDLQGAQASGRFRGVGRYSLSLARAMLQAPRAHEFWVLLNGAMHESAAELAETLAPLIARARIVTMSVPTPIQEIEPTNLWRAGAAEILRESVIAALKPDIVHVSSLFEGIGHDAVTSVGLAEPDVATAVTLYDLIPLLNAETYLADGRVRRWYLRKLESLLRADLLMAISPASAREAVSLLGLPEARVRVIGCGVDPAFRPLPPWSRDDALLSLRYGLTRKVILYAGGGDPRKNLVALLDAFSRLEPGLRARHQIAVVGELWAKETAALLARAAELGLQADELRLLGYVSDADLVALYALCEVFVFPSLHEGFGLPAAEAMACGAPVICSNTGSLPEIIGLPEALFDPNDPADIARCLRAVLISERFRASLRAHGEARGRSFSWDVVAGRAIDALEACSRPALQACRSTAIGKPRLACVAPQADDSVRSLLRSLSGRYEVTHVVADGRDLDGPEEHPVARVSGAWFREHIGDHDRVLHVIDSSPDNAGRGLFHSCPGTVLLRNTRPGEGDEGARLRAVYREHGLSAVASAKRNGVAQVCTEFPILGDLLSLGQGVIVPDRQMADTVTCRYGAKAAEVIQVSSEMEEGRAADTCAEAIERFAADPHLGQYRRITAQLASLAPAPRPDARDWKLVAGALSANLDWRGPSRLLIDVTILVAVDIGPDIQRIMRNIAAELIATPPPGFKVELVRMTEQGFVYARNYAAQLLDVEIALGEDDPVAPQRGDIFLGLDLNMGTPTIRPWFEAARRQAVFVIFVISDLLPATMPEMFGPEMEQLYQRRLETIIDIADGLLCMSRSVAEELHHWIDEHATERRETLRIDWFHPDTKLHTAPSALLPEREHRRVLEAMRSHRSVLAVGTVEPRSGYGQVLAAFDALWQQRVDVTLTIVGDRGRLVDELPARLDTHPERGRRLFWLSGITDSLLAELYRSAGLLLAAALGESFALSLIEASQLGLPVFARDIPVFREILGDTGTYFSTTDPGPLAEALAMWAQSRNDEPVLVREAACSGSDCGSRLARNLSGSWYLTRMRVGERYLWTQADHAVSAATSTSIP